MSEFEKEMIMIQYELLQTQKERNNILKDAFIVHDGTIPALEKLIMILDKI